MNKGVFWERLELHNFPQDVQELSIRLSSDRSSREIKLISDSLNKSCLDLPKAMNTFMEQQKWYFIKWMPSYFMIGCMFVNWFFFNLKIRKLYKFVKVSENGSFDEMKEIQKSNKKHKYLQDYVKPKVVASCYVSRK